MLPITSENEEPTVVDTGHQFDDSLAPLKDIYADHFYIGTIINPGDPIKKFDVIKHHFNFVTAENHMKPSSIWPVEAGGPNFFMADMMLTRAKEAGLLIHGHTLAWHQQSPAWLNAGLDREQARANLQKYIDSVAGHYANEPVKVYSWDVLNEAIRDNPVNPADWTGALRTDVDWYMSYSRGGNGRDYIYDAFLFAREAAPDAILYYNDYNEDNANKATAIASMVMAINERYALEHPDTGGRKLIEGIGMQGHYNTGTNTNDVEAAIRKFIDTGVIVSVTELDVSISGVSADGPSQAQLEVQAELYARLFSLYKKYSAHIERVSFWGVDDPSSWRSTSFPLIFNGDFSAKPAYYAIIDPEGYLD